MDAPLGNLLNLADYDRYWHSYLFTYGNQMIQGIQGTDKYLSDHSYSDIHKAKFRIQVPENSKYTGNLGFKTTRIRVDKDWNNPDRGTNPHLILYGKDGNKLASYDKDWTVTVENGVSTTAVTAPDVSEGQSTGNGQTPADEDPDIWIFESSQTLTQEDQAKTHLILPDGEYISAIEITYDIYYGNDHISEDAGNGLHNAKAPGRSDEILVEPEKVTSEIINTHSRQNWVRIYGKPGTYNDTETEAKDNTVFSTKVIATGIGSSDLSDANNGYLEWFSTGTDRVTDLKNDRKYTQNAVMNAQKAVPTMEVQPHGSGTDKGINGTGYGKDQTERNASIGGTDGWYAIKIGNTGASRIYSGLVTADLPLSISPKDTESVEYVRGFEMSELSSDPQLITNITRDGNILLDTITLKTYHAVETAAAPSYIVIEKDTGYPTIDENGSITHVNYKVTYVKDGTTTTGSISSEKLLKQVDGKWILSLELKTLEDAGWKLEHVQKASVLFGHYPSKNENDVTGDITKKNESLLLIKGSPTGYIYDVDPDTGKITDESDVKKELTLKANWKSQYESGEAKSDGTFGNLLFRDQESFGTLRLEPSKPTIEMSAVKDNYGESGDQKNLDISYEFTGDTTWYKILLGNDSASSASQPILKVELPLRSNEPQYMIDGKAEDGLQEERRRGFQMTGIKLDEKLLGGTDSIGKLVEVRVYGYKEASEVDQTDKDGKELVPYKYLKLFLF